MTLSVDVVILEFCCRDFDPCALLPSVDIATLDFWCRESDPSDLLPSADVATLGFWCRGFDILSRHSSLDVATLDFKLLFAYFLVVLFVFHDIPAKTLNLVKYP